MYTYFVRCVLLHVMIISCVCVRVVSPTHPHSKPDTPAAHYTHTIHSDG